MKRNSIRTILVFAITAILTIALAACGGGGNGGSGIGGNPNIPNFAKNAPESAAALVAAFEANTEFSEVELMSDGGMELVTAKRTVNGKEYAVTAINYGSQTAVAQQFSAMRSAYDTALSMGGEAALKAALAEEGITNFNWNDTGMSYTQDGYEYFWKISGSWWIAQMPYDEENGDENPNGTPGAVALFTATAGNGQVTLSWTAPTNNGGAVITGYEVTRDNWATKISKTSVESSHVFSGLTNGTQYTFKVRAVNSVGAGAESSKTATPNGTDTGTLPPNSLLTAMGLSSDFPNVSGTLHSSIYDANPNNQVISMKWTNCSNADYLLFISYLDDLGWEEDEGLSGDVGIYVAYIATKDDYQATLVLYKEAFLDIPANMITFGAVYAG